MIIQRSFTDELTTEPLGHNLLLMTFEPGQADSYGNKEKRSWIAEADKAESLANGAKDQIEVLTDGQKVRRYSLFTPEGYEFFFKKGRHGMERNQVIAHKDVAKAVRDGHFDPELVLGFDGYDGSAYKPGREMPISVPLSIEIGSIGFDLPSLQKHISKNPWVLESEIVPQKVAPNIEITGRELLEVTLMLDQDTFDQYNMVLEDRFAEKSKSAYAPRHIGYLSGSEIESWMIWPNRLDNYREGFAEQPKDLPEDFHDPLKIREFAIKPRSYDEDQDYDSY